MVWILAETLQQVRNGGADSQKLHVRVKRNYL
jgi:hypothetical protein